MRSIKIVHNLGIINPPQSYIDLTHISKNSVQSFDIAVDKLENSHFILNITQNHQSHIVPINIETSNKVERSIATEDQLILSQFHNITLPIIPVKS